MKEFLLEVSRWVVNNREWLFSGVGVTIIGGLFVFVFKRDVGKNIKDNPRNDSLLNVFYTLEQPKDLTSETNKKVYSMVDRFIMIFEAHGVSINQISSFVDPIFNLKIVDFKDKDSILRILDNRLIEWTCTTFGIERKWLDGEDERIYSSRDYYKRVQTLLKLLVELKKNHENELEIYMFKNGYLTPMIYGKSYVVFIIRIPFKELNGRPVSKYIPITTNWDWGYWRSRYQIKSIIFFMSKLNIYIHGYDLPAEFSELASGNHFPEPILNNLKIGYTWYPEDYIDLPSQSTQAKETEETMKVRNYIEEEGYHNYFKKLMYTCEKR